MVPALILVTSSLAAGSAMLFGWAKPVPVNFGRLRNPKADMLWAAAARWPTWRWRSAGRCCSGWRC